ncbi:YveK family protein [Paenibacillus sambharensis]|uniref:YveK family protein n=1 Tax=Paenibacillus sambharensis TaxID=1803190 RepID=UPI001FEA5091|nr:Wzz/FepE/Etk N-terminal domain-containing protein [Paenibacillus sambharensis]
MELKQYWAIVRRRLWLIGLLVVVLASVTGFYSYKLVVPQYQASTKLIVNPSHKPAEAAGNVELGSINTSIQLVKTYKEIIRTSRIMGVVASEYPDLKTSAGELISKINVASVSDTMIITLAAVDTSYPRAANMVNAVAEVFQREIPELMKVDNVSILNEADPSAAAYPVSPNPTMNMAVSIMLALMLGVALAFLLDYLDDTIKTSSDVEQALGLSTLTSIPRMKNSDRSQARTKQQSAAQPLRGEGNVSVDT